MRIPVGLVALVVLLAAPAALADTIKVPGDFGTIQAAVDAADDGDTVLVAPGDYSETVTISGKTDLQLRGKGWPALVGPDVGIVIVSCTRLVIRGFELDDADIEVSDSDSVTLTKLRVHGIANAIVSDANDGLVISKCEFSDILGTVVFDEHSTGFVVEKCRFENVGSAVILGNISGPGTNGAVLSKNRVIDATNGFTIGGTDTLVEKNRMEELDNWGVLTNGTVSSDGSRIVKNRIQTIADGGIIATGDDLVVSKNVLTGGALSVTGADCVVAGNKLYDTNTHAVLCIGTMTIERNRVRGSGGLGLSSQGSGCTIFANTVLDTEGVGFEIWGAGSDVSRNRATDAGTVGFYVLDGGNVFTKNRASGSGVADLGDMQPEGQNEYLDNRFGTIVFSYVP